MKPFELLDSMDNIHDKFILEAEDLEKLKTKPRRRPRGLTLLVAALTVALMALTAFAATEFLGIRDMTDGTIYELPSEADAYIETQQVQATSGDITCTVVESIFDTSYFMVSVNVSCGDKYVLIPTYCNPSDSVSEIGLEGDETLEEYAARLGKKLLLVAGDLENRDELGIGVIDLDMESQSDSSLTILLSGQKSASVEATDSAVSIVIREAGTENRQSISVPFTVNQAPAEQTRVYLPDNADAIPGITFHSVTVTDGVTGTSVTFDADVTDEKLFYDIAREKADEITRYSGGWMLDSETNKWGCTWTGVEGAITDTLTVHFYGDLDNSYDTCLDEELIGTIVFTLSED